MARLGSCRFRRTALLCTGYIGILLGIGLAHTGYRIHVWWCWLGIGLMSMAWRRHNAATMLLVVLCAISLGWWRGEAYMKNLDAYQALYLQKITITVRAINDGAYGKYSQMSFDANDVQLQNGQRLVGKIQLSGFGMNAIYQGDEVRVTGKMYPGYGAYQGRVSYARLELVRHHPSIVASVRRKFAAGMQSALPEPLAPFAMGLLIGQRATLPEENKHDLLVVGLTHIIAVSGYNLTIMLHASKRVFGKRSKRLSTALSMLLIGSFLLLAGLSASIVRAAIVSTLSICASYYGRNFRPINLIALAAAITAWANPFYIWSDIGWYLSFLAFYGVMVLAPLFLSRLPRRYRNSLIVMVATESLCAEAMTIPFVLYIFGQMSFIGLPANVLVVTLVPLAMLLSLVAGLAGMLVSAFSGWLAWPASIVLTYMLDVAHGLAQMPHIFIEHIGLSLLQMLGLYLLIAGLTYLLQNKTKQQKSATVTDKKLILQQGVAFERS